MQCPSCNAANPGGQKFCGACGHTLEAACPRCKAANPPSYKFCGHCGTAMTATGSITIARSGLIHQIDDIALDILGYQENEMRGKSFSLFVEREDLVIFFSHLNELVSSSQRQSFEISLKHKDKGSLYSLVEGRLDENASGVAKSIHLSLSKAADHREDGVRLQTQEDLLGLIFTVTHNVSTAGQKHQARSIEDALKKICLFTKADDTVIWGINHSSKHLEPLYQWPVKPNGASQKSWKAKSVSLSKIKHVILKLRQEKTMVIDHLEALEGQERTELLSWHHDDVKAAVGHMIYSGKMPLGVICSTRKIAEDQWTLESIALLQFFGNFISNRLPYPVFNRRAGDNGPAAAPIAPPTKKSAAKRRTNASAIKTPPPDGATGSTEMGPEDSWRILPDVNRPMQFERFSGDSSLKQQTVFPRDDGLALMTCPKCGRQETIPLEQFDRLGNAIAVDCPCRKRFTAVLEKRRAFRKQVHLDGYFSTGADFGDTAPKESLWGQMVVIDLSKSGLRFTTEKAGLLNAGDSVTVRFNLDNSNRAPIHKTARVIAVTGFDVGCRFESADSYDITLGFYFM